MEIETLFDKNKNHSLKQLSKPTSKVNERSENNSHQEYIDVVGLSNHYHSLSNSQKMKSSSTDSKISSIMNGSHEISSKSCNNSARISFSITNILQTCKQQQIHDGYVFSSEHTIAVNFLCGIEFHLIIINVRCTQHN